MTSTSTSSPTTCEPPTGIYNHLRPPSHSFWTASPNVGGSPSWAALAGIGAVAAVGLLWASVWNQGADSHEQLQPAGGSHGSQSTPATNGSQVVIGIGKPSLSGDPRILYFTVAESTLARHSDCFVVYTTHARWTGSEFDITATMLVPRLDPNDDPPVAGCADIGVEAYVEVRLPLDYTGQPVRDMSNGQIRKVGPRVYPTADQIVNRPSR